MKTCVFSPGSTGQDEKRRVTSRFDENCVRRKKKSKNKYKSNKSESRKKNQAPKNPSKKNANQKSYESVEGKRRKHLSLHSFSASASMS